MAISGIENINIGVQNEAAGSDSLYTAFNKSKNNFTTLFSCASPTTNFVGGNGIAVAYSNSNTYLTITNTGVTRLTAGDSSIVLTQSNGNIIITAPGGGNGGGGVSNINVIGAASGARITSTGGPIISSGIITLDLATSGANAGTYTYPTVTVDQYGRITSIANASSVGTVSSVGVVTTGTGIQISGSPITSAGNISIINTGVTRLNAGTGISLSSSNGNITVSVAGGGIGVSSVGIASNSLVVTNSPITGSGTMSVDLPTNTAIVGNLTVGNNLSVTGNGTITGNLTVTGNIISSANVIGTLTANNLTVSGASSGNSNVSTVTGNLGLRTLASTYTDNVSAAGTIATAAIHAIDVPTLAASNAVTFTNAASFYIAGGPAAGTNATITTGYSLYVNSGNTYFGGANNVIAGNLTVNGNTTYLNVETFVVEDPIISLGGGPNGTALTTNDGKDRGTALQYYTSTPVTAFMGWDNGNGEFTFGSNVTIASEVVTYNTLGNVRGLTWLGNVVGTTANLTTGNMTTGNITTINSGLMQNGTANITIASNGSISIFANANATAALVIANSGINVPGYSNTVGTITGGNISTIGANGTVQANNHTITGAASGIVNVAATLGNLGFRTVAATYTDTAVTGTQANAAIHVIDQPTIGGGTNAKTYTNMSTFYIANAPAATTNATITNSYAMFVGAGNSYFGGNISFAANGNITMSGNASQISGSNLVSANFLVGTGITASGAASGNANITAGAGNLGIRALAATYTDTQATIPSGNAAIHVIGTPTITGGTNAKVYSNLSTFYIASQPTLGANASLFASTGQSYALFVAGGNSYFGGLISASANVTAPIFTSNIATGTAPFVVTSTTQVANLNVATSGSATSATNAAAVQTNTSTGTTVYLAGVTTGSNANSALNIVSGITANFAANSIAATTFNGNISNASSVIANAANGTVFSNNYTASGAATGNANVSTVTGNLGIRAIASTYTDNSAIASATITSAAAHAIATPTYAAANTGVIATNAASFYIQNAPVAGTNMTITNPYALYVAAGNSYFGGLISASANVTAPIFTSNIAVGTAPFTVTSTTRVTNLNVAYSNVSDYGVIAAQTTGVYYPVMINAGTSGNYALAVGPTGISHNLATNVVTATTFNGNLSASTATVTGSANIGNINSQSTTGASFNISGATQATANTAGGNIVITSGFGNGTGNGGGFYAFAGNAGSNSSGGEAQLGAGTSIGTDKAGNITTIFGGRGTGTGTPGNVAIQVSTALTTGTTTQTLSNVVVVSPTGMTLAANSNISMSGASSQISGGNLVSANFLVGSGITASGNATGSANIATITGNLGIRALFSTYTDNSAISGATIANAAIHAFAAPNLAAANTLVTFTNAATFYIANAPVANTNATITNPYSLFVAAGNSYFGGLISAASNVTAPIFTSNIAVGTAPFTVTSTTRVTNLNVAYSNVSDYGVVTAQTTGTYYPVMINAGTAGNYALAVGPTGISYNLATNAVTATTFSGNLSGSTATVTGSANIGNINSQSTAGASFNISGATQATANTVGGNINITAGIGNGTGAGGSLNLYAGNAAATSNASGGAAQLVAGVSYGTDQAGGVTTIKGGAGTGAGAPGNVAIQVSTALVSGTTTQTLSNVVVVSSTGMTLAANGNIAMSGNASQLAGGNLVSANFLVGTGITSSGDVSGNANIATITGNIGIRALAATYTDNQPTVGSGNAAVHAIAQPTVGGGTNTKAYTNLSTFYIANAPAVTTNATATNSYALFVGAGNSFFGGNIIGGPYANGNSNVYIATAAGNVTIAATGNTVMTIANTGVSVNGYAAGYSISSAQLGTPATPSAAGSTTGGTLAAANYYFKIVAIDGFGQVTAPSAESTVVTTTGATSSIAVSWTATVAATSYRIYFATTTNTYTLGYFTSITNSFTLTTTAGSIAGTIPVNNITGSITANGFLLSSVGAGLSAAGTVQANATVITKEFNQYTTVAAGTGVVFPQPAVAGMKIYIRNAQAVNALLVYPAANGTINLGAANVAFSMPLSSSNTFWCVSASPAPGGTWYTAT